MPTPTRKPNSKRWHEKLETCPRERHKDAAWGCLAALVAALLLLVVAGGLAIAVGGYVKRPDTQGHHA